MHLNWANVGFDPYVEFRRLDYHDSALYPLASGPDGTLLAVALSAAGQIIEGVRWQARVAFYHSDDAFPGIAMTGMPLTFGFLAWSPRCGRAKLDCDPLPRCVPLALS